MKCDLPYTFSLNLWEEQKNSRGEYYELDLNLETFSSKSQVQAKLIREGRPAIVCAMVQLLLE